MRVRLNETAVIILNGSGAGTAKVGPLSAREIWYPTVASVKANTLPTNEAQCQIFKGEDSSQSNYVDGTFSGSSGDSSQNVTGEMRLGNWIWAVWTGGDANVQAILTVSGEKEV